MSGGQRTCYPKGTRLIVVLDNLRLVHDHPRFLDLCERLGIELVFTPTEASWLKAITVITSHGACR